MQQSELLATDAGAPPSASLGRDEYIALCEQKGEAPIKQAYIRLVSARVAYPWRHVGAAAVGANVTDGATGDVNDVLTGQMRGKGGRLEQNRKRALGELENAVRLCHRWVTQGSCEFGDTCKYSHDMDAFLKGKPEDLEGACPWTGTASSEGGCPFGVACRYYGAHGSPPPPSVERRGDATGDGAACRERCPEDRRFWMDDGTVPGAPRLPVVIDVVRRVLRPMNDLSGDARAALRKRVYDFTSARAALQALEIPNTIKSNANKSTNGTAAATTATTATTATAAGTKRANPDVGAIPVEDGRKHTLGFDARGKTFLAPLTTVGNLPFRRLCKRFGADITCGEMAMAHNLLQGQASEWALLKRHPDEDFFGVQICGAHGDAMAHAAQLIEDTCAVDFVDINCGCPIDCVVNKGAGSACLTREKKLEQIVRSMTAVLSCPVTIKMRRGFDDGNDLAHKLVPRLGAWGVSAAVLHGRTRQQRYSKPADWDYIRETARVNDSPCQVIGNGDVFGWQDHVKAIESGDVVTTYVARGALIKPWIFTEIKERRDWDISASERLDIIRQFVQNGLEHWGSDSRGVENTRRFLLEWLSFTHRYIPCGLLEVLPQRSNWRPSAFVGRTDLETLLASPDPADWIQISSWFLGPVPSGYTFRAKHQAKGHGGGGRVENG